MDNSSSTSWFGNLKKKMTNLYNTAKGTPVETTPILPPLNGGSKKKKVEEIPKVEKGYQASSF